MHRHRVGIKTGQSAEECCCVSHQSQSLRRAPHSRYKALEGGVGANFWRGVIPHRGLKGQEGIFWAKRKERKKDRRKHSLQKKEN